MHAVLHATLSVLVLLLAIERARGQAEPLPPIFVPRALPRPAAEAKSPPTPAASAVSSRTRSLITERLLLADAAVFRATTAPEALEIRRGEVPGDTVMMDALMVKSAPLRIINTARADPFLLNYLKTGTLYHHVGRTVTTDIALRFLPVQATGYGNREASTRVELSFSFRW